MEPIRILHEDVIMDQGGIDAGYDICTTADWLTEFYLRKHKEVAK